MEFEFSKYSGAGNTFLFFDDRSLSFKKEMIPSLCQNEAVDGVILLQPPLRMRIFNPDGNEASMCGNGLRCFVKYLVELGIKQSLYHIETGAGILEAGLVGEDVAVNMIQPHSIQWNLVFEGRLIHYLNTGVPHAVQFVDEIDQVKIEQEGSHIRYHPHFMPEGTNATFASLKNGLLFIRTYERGVERETDACGTGAVASALAAAKLFSLSSSITVVPLSKENLTICFKRIGDLFFDVKMLGPAKKLSQGSILI